MAQLATQKRNVRESPDWDSYLYSLWKKNMTLNPGLYDDAMLHHGWSCKCCSRTVFFTERYKRK